MDQHVRAGGLAIANDPGASGTMLGGNSGPHPQGRVILYDQSWGVQVTSTPLDRRPVDRTCSTGSGGGVRTSTPAFTSGTAVARKLTLFKLYNGSWNRS